jgi:NADH:ubiquinone oxidoreductase subunit 6 (subunit J)
LLNEFQYISLLSTDFQSLPDTPSLLLKDESKLLYLTFFLLLSFLLISSYCVLYFKKLMNSLTHLIIVFLTVSLMLLLLNLDFLAVLTLLIYIGAIMVFFLFAILLLLKFFSFKTLPQSKSFLISFLDLLVVIFTVFSFVFFCSTYYNVFLEYYISDINDSSPIIVEFSQMVATTVAFVEQSMPVETLLYDPSAIEAVFDPTCEALAKLVDEITFIQNYFPEKVWWSGDVAGYIQAQFKIRDKILSEMGEAGEIYILYKNYINDIFDYEKPFDAAFFNDMMDHSFPFFVDLDFDLEFDFLIAVAFDVEFDNNYSCLHLLINHSLYLDLVHIYGLQLYTVYGLFLIVAGILLSIVIYAALNISRPYRVESRFIYI